MDKHTFKMGRSMVFLITVILLTAVGCQSFQKKFVRPKKKDQKEEFIPVLDPIEYPKAIFSPEKEYSQHYSLWKVWNKELIQEIDLGENDKRQVYLLNESILQIQEMEKLVLAEKQGVFNQVLSNFEMIKQEFDKPSVMRQTNTLKKKLERNAEDIMNILNPTLMKVNLIQGEKTF